MDNVALDALPYCAVVFEAYKEGFIVRACNDKTLRSENVKRKDFINKPLAEVFSNAYETKLLDALRRVFFSGEESVFEISLYRGRRVCGFRRTKITKLDATHLLVLYEDVPAQNDDMWRLKHCETQTDRLRDRIVNLEKYLKKSQEIARFGIWELRSDGSFRWSEEIYKMLGVDPNEDVPPSYDTFLRFVHPKDKSKVRKAYLRSVKHKLDCFVQFRIVAQNDHALAPLYVEARGEHVYNAYGYEASMGVLIDITKSKQKELALNQAIEEEIAKNAAKEKELLRQSKMAQAGELLSMIAHQWRQPLGAISTTVANLELKFAMGAFSPTEFERCKTYLLERFANINTYVQNLTATIDDFRNFYMTNKAVTHATLETVVKKSLHIIRPSLLHNGIHIEERYDDVAEIKVYFNEMMQVVLNILKNAEDNFIERKVNDKSVYVHVEGKKLVIRDNGGGIDEEIVERIFDPYFSTKRDKNGTGLGLYMSKTIVEKHHGGKLYAYNDENGAVFVVDLSNGGG